MAFRSNAGCFNDEFPHQLLLSQITVRFHRALALCIKTKERS